MAIEKYVVLYYLLCSFVQGSHEHFLIRRVYTQRGKKLQYADTVSALKPQYFWKNFYLSFWNLDIHNTCRECRKSLILLQPCICPGLHSTECVLGTGLELRLGSVQVSTGQINEQFVLTDPAFTYRIVTRPQKRLRENMGYHRYGSFLIS